jgi:hypothetical protein
MGKLSKKNLKDKCDRLYSLIIRSRGYCEYCHNRIDLPVFLNAHHVIGRINYLLRWDLRNGCCLCVGCHRFNKNSAHENPLAFMEWFKSTRPEDYEYLRDPKWQQSKTWYISDYEKIYQDLKTKYNEIQSQY